jgi:hypothetical protein
VREVEAATKPESGLVGSRGEAEPGAFVPCLPCCYWRRREPRGAWADAVRRPGACALGSGHRAAACPAHR